MFTFRSIDLVATNRHKINIEIIDINRHLACCLGCICMKEDVLGLAQFSWKRKKAKKKKYI
jgi:hypothetical protein